MVNISSGHPDIIIGVIDGPVDFNHPAFQESRIRTVKDSQLGALRMLAIYSVYTVHL